MSVAAAVQGRSPTPRERWKASAINEATSLRAVLAAMREVAGRCGAELTAAAAAATLYLPALGYGFVFDDVSLIGDGGVPVPLGGALPYRPLRYASYLVDAALGGSAAVYHAHNLVLHAVAAALVVRIARRLGAGPLAALAAALAFAFHPLAVEAVAYVSGRRDLLCTAFGLASLLAALAGRSGVALVLLVAGAAAKESALVFAAPLVVALAAGGLSRIRAGAVVALGSAAALAIFAYYGAVGPWIPSIGARGLAAAGQAALHYATGIAQLRPVAIEYPGLVAASGGGFAPAAFAVVVLLAAAAAMAAALRSGRGFALAWIAAGFAAVSFGGSMHEPGADRHAYLLLPALAVAAAVGWSSACRALRGRQPGGQAGLRAAAFACAALWIGASAATSRAAMERWRDERSLWSEAASAPAASPRARANFARVLAADGRLRDAAGQLRRAIRADRSDPLVFLARAAVRCAEGRTSAARRDLHAALRLGVDSRLVGEIAADCGSPR